MNLIHSKRMGALLAALVLAAAGCGGSSSKDTGNDGNVGPAGFHVAVVLPDALKNGGPTGFDTTVSGVTVSATLDGKAVTPDEVDWAITDVTGQWDPPGAAEPNPAKGLTMSFAVPSFDALREAGNAWLKRAYAIPDDVEVEYIRAPARQQILSFGPQQVQAMSFQVIATVKSGSNVATASAVVSPVTVSRGGNPQPLGMMVVANAAGDTGNSWDLKYLPTAAAAGTAFGSPPSGVALQAAQSKNPYFVPTVAGIYQLQNGSNTPILFRVSTYHGAGRSDADKGSDGVACNGCHTVSSHGDHTLTQFAEWQESAHFASAGTDPAVSLFQHGIDGGFGPRYTEGCASCHVVGYSKVPTAVNNGFDDVADAAHWTFPVPAAGNFAAMPAGLKHRAGVQCESCHGPLEPADHSMVAAVGYGTVAPVASMDAGICMTCHDGMEDGNQGPQWATTGHADIQLSLDDASIESRGTGANHCGRCHAAEGFAVYLAQMQTGNSTTAAGNIARPTTCAAGTPGCTCTTDTPPVCTVAAAATCTPRTGYTASTDPYDPLCPCRPTGTATTCTGDPALYYYLGAIGLGKATIHSVTCQTCHDPHTTKLRVESGDTKVTAAYFRVQNAGKGALCIVCHNSRGGAVRQGAMVLSGFTAPHAASQGDVFVGRNAFFISELSATAAATDVPRASPHLAKTADACVTCHVRSVPEDIREKFNVTGTNHTFTATMEVCKNCHSATDAAGFETAREANEAKLAALGTRITDTIKSRLNASGFDAGTRYDYDTDGAIAAPSDPTIEPGQVTAVALYESHGSPAVKLTLSGGIKFATTLANIRVYNAAAATNTFFVVSTGTSPSLVAGADQDFARAVYNYLLIHGGAAGGVHNFQFTSDVLDASLAAIPAP